QLFFCAASVYSKRRGRQHPRVSPPHQSTARTKRPRLRRALPNQLLLRRPLRNVALARRRPKPVLLRHLRPHLLNSDALALEPRLRRKSRPARLRDFQSWASGSNRRARLRVINRQRRRVPPGPLLLKAKVAQPSLLVAAMVLSG